MIKRDTERLVRKVAVLDNRVVNEAVIDAWHEVVGHIAYEVAERALVKARQDPNVPYLEPRHVLAKCREAIMELNDEHRTPEERWHSDPEPVCRPHSVNITKCVECCSVLSARAKEFPREDLHGWAVANLYRPVVELVGEPF